MNEDCRLEPDQSWDIDLFCPQDAEGVTRLFRSVYGDGYPVRTFIDPGTLQEQNRNRKVISSVARTAAGDVVGHNALFRSAPYKGVYESGAGLVHRDYRGGKGIFTAMVAHGVKMADRFGVETIFGEPVCNHVFSQKMTNKLGWVTMALEVDLMPAAAYAKEASARARVSALLDFIALSPKPCTVYLPRGYEEFFEFLYAAYGDERSLEPGHRPVPADAATRIEVQFFPFAAVARMAVWEAGADFQQAWAAEEKKVLDQGATVIQAWLNTGQPWISRVVDWLRQKGYFAGGVLPRWFDSDGMLMMKLFHSPGWQDIKLEFQRARELLEMVRADWSLANAS